MKTIKTILVFMVTLILSGSVIAGGVSNYTGNALSSGAAIATGTGNSASADLLLELKIGSYIALGVYDTNGNISNPIFSSNQSNFPTGSVFSTYGTVLLNAESSLASKFDLDGTTSTLDQSKIVNAMLVNSDLPSEDILIKGAIYSNLPASTNISISTSQNSIQLAGGNGNAPVIKFRGLAGTPSAAIDSSESLGTDPISLQNKRNSKGYARFVIVGDLDESSVDLSTQGNWYGSLTIRIDSY
ncbi:MAG: hypothetical protein SFU25_05575 [Candidatus Caenarcaniphilales bacterium]|nr:hypothetical protein [Candidatus Caenarcaniphilales bacterium]